MSVTEKQKMLAGELYLGNDPALVAERRRARDLLRAYNATADDEETRRAALLKTLFEAIGPGATIEPAFRCDYGYNLAAGANLFVNFDCVSARACSFSRLIIRSIPRCGARGWRALHRLRSATTSGSAAASSSARG